MALTVATKAEATDLFSIASEFAAKWKPTWGGAPVVVSTSEYVPLGTSFVPISRVFAPDAFPPATELGNLEVFPAVVDLDVIQSDIDRGVRRHAETCAVALAAKRRWDGARVQVGGASISITTDLGTVHHYYGEDVSLMAFISRFDSEYPNLKPATIRVWRLD